MQCGQVRARDLVSGDCAFAPQDCAVVYSRSCSLPLQSMPFWDRRVKRRGAHIGSVASTYSSASPTSHCLCSSGRARRVENSPSQPDVMRTFMVRASMGGGVLALVMDLVKNCRVVFSLSCQDRLLRAHSKSQNHEEVQKSGLTFGRLAEC